MVYNQKYFILESNHKFMYKCQSWRNSFSICLTEWHSLTFFLYVQLKYLPDRTNFC